MANSRPQNSGRSKDDVQPRWPFVRTNIRFTGHLDWTLKQATRKNIYMYTALHFQGDKHPFSLNIFICWDRIFMLLLRFFNIMTSQKRDMTDITFLWWVNMTASSPSNFILEFLDSVSWVQWHSENSLLKSMHSVHLHFQFLYPNIGWQIWKSQTRIMLDLLGETGHRWQSFCEEIQQFLVLKKN